METPHTLRSRLATGTAVLTASLLLYILSSGPAARLANRSDALLPVFQRIYHPLIVAAAYTPLLPYLEQYVNWWEALNAH